MKPNQNCPHCKGTGRIVFDDLPTDVFECACTAPVDPLERALEALKLVKKTRELGLYDK
jgi:hypothetical protein